MRTRFTTRHPGARFGRAGRSVCRGLAGLLVHHRCPAGIGVRESSTIRPAASRGAERERVGAPSARLPATPSRQPHRRVSASRRRAAADHKGALGRLHGPRPYARESPSAAAWRSSWRRCSRVSAGKAGSPLGDILHWSRQLRFLRHNVPEGDRTGRRDHRADHPAGPGGASATPPRTAGLAIAGLVLRRCSPATPPAPATTTRP